jgi:D-arabinose 1-dehydrogenase-like Zn-dependent alcohol dehydrogenase
VIKELPDLKPKAGHVLIAVKAFGVNQAETHIRKGDWAEAAEVSGIECVGEVVAAPGGEFQRGDKVAAFMGGGGRLRGPFLSGRKPRCDDRAPDQIPFRMTTELRTTIFYTVEQLRPVSLASRR